MKNTAIVLHHKTSQPGGELFELGDDKTNKRIIATDLFYLVSYFKHISFELTVISLPRVEDEIISRGDYPQATISCDIP